MLTIVIDYACEKVDERRRIFPISVDTFINNTDRGTVLDAFNEPLDSKITFWGNPQEVNHYSTWRGGEMTVAELCDYYRTNYGKTFAGQYVPTAEEARRRRAR